MEHVQVLIIGAGMAGLSAAIWCERLGLTYAVIESGDAIGGQISQIHNRIWDFPPKIYADGTELLAELNRHETIAHGAIHRNESVVWIDLDRRRIHTTRSTYQVDYLIVATGIRPNRLPILQNHPRVLAPWFSTTSQARQMEGKQVLVIGGGDRAVESAINLSPYARTIWLAVRGKQLRARDTWQKRLAQCPNVTVLLETELAEADDRTPSQVVLANRTGKTTLRLEADWILPRIGVKANSELLPGLPKHGEGFLVVDEQQRTPSGWIYAIGDVANGPEYSSLALASGQAMKALKHIILRIKEHPDDVSLYR